MTDRNTPAARRKIEGRLRSQLAVLEATPGVAKREALAWALRRSPGWGKTHGRVIRRALRIWIDAYDALSDEARKALPHFKTAHWLRATYATAVPIPGADPPKTRRRRRA